MTAFLSKLYLIIINIHYNYTTVALFDLIFYPKKSMRKREVPKNLHRPKVPLEPRPKNVKKSEICRKIVGNTLRIRSASNSFINLDFILTYVGNEKIFGHLIKAQTFLLAFIFVNTCFIY